MPWHCVSKLEWKFAIEIWWEIVLMEPSREIRLCDLPLTQQRTDNAIFTAHNTPRNARWTQCAQHSLHWGNAALSQRHNARNAFTHSALIITICTGHTHTYRSSQHSSNTDDYDTGLVVPYPIRNAQFSVIYPESDCVHTLSTPYIARYWFARESWELKAGRVWKWRQFDG